MKEFIIYLLEVGACIGLWGFVYRLALRSSTFFRFNRWFLLFGVFASFVIPCIQFKYDVYVKQTNLILSATEANLDVQSSFSVWYLLLIIYLMGIVAVLIKNIMSYVRVHQLIKGGEKNKTNQFVMVDNSSVKSPFTIFKYILYNNQKLSGVEKELIIEHEIAHVEQKHWIDLLCCECALLLQWFNPLMWVYVSLIKENHEFLADKAVLDAGHSPVTYKAVLVNQTFDGSIFSFTNSFNLSNQLNRLNMIKKEKSSSWKKLSTLALMPIFGMFFWVSATPNYVVQADRDVIPNKEKPSVSNDSIQRKLLYIVNGKELAGTPDIDPQIIESISVLKDKSATDVYGEKGKNGVVLITLKKTEVQASVRSEDNTSLAEPKPLYVVDGVEVADVSGIDPQTIESVTVSKDKSAIEVYGEKAKNGVFIIVLKK